MQLAGVRRGIFCMADDWGEECLVLCCERRRTKARTCRRWDKEDGEDVFREHTGSVRGSEKSMQCLLLYSKGRRLFSC